MERGSQTYFSWAMVGLGYVVAVLFLLPGFSLSDTPSPEESRGVAVVVGPQAPMVEVYAGTELCHYLHQLFGIDVQPSTSVPDEAISLFLVGTPATNPTVSQAIVHGSFPKVDDQGIVLRRTKLKGRKALLVGGGSPKATLWAVYELARRWGVNFLLHGDVLPKQTRFTLPDVDVVIEPKLKARQWRVLNEFPMGPASWGMADYRPVLDQLAKLKFNRLLIVLWPFSPYLDYKVNGIQRSSASIFFGYHFPVTPDMVGRQLYGNEREFWNPDLPINASYKEFNAAGERLVHNIIAYGHERGLECLLGLTPTHFPVEFAPLLKGGIKIPIVGVTVATPGPATDIDDPGLAKLSATMIQSAVNTYPEADGLDLTMPEHRQWTGVYERAWNALDRRYGIEKLKSLSSVLDAADHRQTYPGGTKRAVDEVKGDIASLYFYDRLFNNLKILKNTRHPDVRLEFDAIAEELYPIIGKVLPPGAEVLNFVDYTPSRIVARQQVLKEVPGQKVPALLIYTLNDDNIGPVPQLTTGSFYTLTQDLIQYGWAGFSTRYWNIGDQDSNVSYLSRAAWEAGVRPEETSRDQLRAVCGEACIAPMLDAFDQVQKATIGLEWNALGFSFPVPGMLMKYWKPTSVPTALAECQAEYKKALDDVRRAETLAPHSDADNYLDYWEGRLEFAVEYFNTVEEVNRAAMAEAAGNRAETLQDAQKALDSVRAGITAFAHVARDQSDRGAIAMLNEYAYRPLTAKVNSLKNQVPH